MIAYLLANIPLELVGGAALAAFGVLWAVISGGSNRRKGASAERQKMREELQDVRDEHAAIDQTFIDSDDAFDRLRGRSSGD